MSTPMKIKILTGVLLILSFSAFSPISAEPNMSSIDLKKLLKNDFGIDLDIAGGTGGSGDDPIIVLSQSHEEALRTENMALKGLGLGRQVYWRSIGLEPIPSNSKKTYQRKIETIQLTNDQVITQKENYYFSRERIDNPPNPISVFDVVHHDSTTGLVFPYELTWLKFEDHTVYEDPLHGYSVAYGAMGMKSTIYVYPIDDREPSHAEEIKNAIGDVHAMYGSDSIEHDWGGVRNGTEHSDYFFIPKNGNGDTSHIHIRMYQGHFVKIRNTFVDEPVMRKIFGSYMSVLTSILKRSDSDGSSTTIQ
jgi:hypothetical protein